MLKRDLVSTHLRRGTALVLAASVAGIAGITQAGPTKGGTLTVGLETDVRGFDTVKGGVYGVSGRTVAGALEAGASPESVPQPAVSAPTIPENAATLAHWERQLRLRAAFMGRLPARQRRSIAAIPKAGSRTRSA